MPARWGDRLFTATLLKFLAPPSGLKISYSAGDLAAYTGLDLASVERELTRLSGPDARILRQREFKDSVRFELQHDALVRHITPWRDGVLAEAAAAQRLKWLGVGAALVVVLVVVERAYQWKVVRDNTDKRVNALAGMTADEREQRSGNTLRVGGQLSPVSGARPGATAALARPARHTRGPIASWLRDRDVARRR